MTKSPRACAGDEAGVINSKGYRRIMIDGRRYYSSRLAWFHMMDAWPEHTVDHHNGIRSDDRWENLREASHAENAWNRCGSETTYTGIKGVSLFRRRGKPYAWRVSITTNGKRRRSFCHGSLDQAAAVYEQMARELHGEFARTE